VSQLEANMPAESDALHDQALGAIDAIGNAPAGIQDSYRKQMNELVEAQQYSGSADAKLSADSNSQQENAHLQQLRAQLDATAASETKMEFQLRRESIDRKYVEQFQPADHGANDKADDAGAAGVKFSTEQRVRELREAADAENDPVRKQQLLREAAAADEAGKQDRDALQKELQRANAQASALNSTQHGGLGPNVEDVSGRLADTAKRLDDAATKLDKLVSNAKTPTVLKD